MISPLRLAPILDLLLAGCASYQPVSDDPVRIGPPYTVRGVTYVPGAQPDYDQVGYASWYGPESGDRTARGGEIPPRRDQRRPPYIAVTILCGGH